MWRWTSLVVVTGAVCAAAAVWAMSGVYNVAADEPHWRVTSGMLQLVRERSIATRSDGVTVPDLTDTKMVSEGAAHYASMCVMCHLAPGVEDAELRKGLYPAPPDLTRGSGLAAAESFWVIKHGIKMSAMPAWGTTHDEASIWALVSFIQVLPSMDASTYASLTQDVSGHDHASHAGVDDLAHEASGAAAPAAHHDPHTHVPGEDHH